MLRDGRVVRALRVSSRPPKAGAPFPAELSARLTEATSAALTSDTTSDRFATVIDALAFAPVRQNVKPQGVPEKPTDELRAAVEKLASRIPQVAAEFGIEPAAAPSRPPRGGTRGTGRRDRSKAWIPPAGAASAAATRNLASPAAPDAAAAPATPPTPTAPTAPLEPATSADAAQPAPVESPTPAEPTEAAAPAEPPTGLSVTES